LADTNIPDIVSDAVLEFGGLDRRSIPIVCREDGIESVASVSPRMELQRHGSCVQETRS
jgi:hypothetical protein